MQWLLLVILLLTFIPPPNTPSFLHSPLGRQEPPTHSNSRFPSECQGLTVHIFCGSYVEIKSTKEVWFTVTHPCWWQDLQKHNWQILPCAPGSKRSLARGGAYRSFWGDSSLKSILLPQQQNPHTDGIPGLQHLFCCCFFQQVPGYLGSCFFFRKLQNRLSSYCFISWSGEISPCKALPAAPVLNVETKIKTSHMSFREIQLKEGKAEAVWKEC